APRSGSVGGESSLEAEGEELERLAKSEEQTQRRTQLLKLKAEAELARLKSAPAAPAATAPRGGPPSSKQDDAGAAPAGKPAAVDPEKVKAGLQKAVDLAPQAAQQMDRAQKALAQKDRKQAFAPAEAARKILEEIQKAQPPSESPDQKNRKDEQKKSD